MKTAIVMAVTAWYRLLYGANDAKVEAAVRKALGAWAD